MPMNTGDKLAGLAAVVQLINKFRDPNRDQRTHLMQLLQTRPDLIQQYKDQDNPDISKTLAGMKPRFGPSGGYDQLTNLIDKTPASAETIRNQYLKSTLKGAQTDKTAALALSPINPLGANTLSNSDRVQSADEYLREGKIKSPEDRKKEQLQLGREQTQYDISKGELDYNTKANPLKLEREKALTDEGISRAAIAKQEADEKEKERKRIETARAIAYPAIGSLPKGTNLYEAAINGKISPEAANAIWAAPDTQERIKNDRMIFQEQQAQNMNAQQRKDMRVNAFVTDLMKDAMDAGTPISIEQATAVANNPQLAEGNAVIKKSLDGIRDFNKRKYLPAAHASFLRETAPIFKNMSLNGKGTEEDVQALNNASQNAFGATGFEPITYGLVDVIDKEGKPKRAGIPVINRHNKQVVGIIGGDKELISKYKGMFPVELAQDKAEEVDPIVKQALSKFNTEQEFLEDMKKGNVPNSTQSKFIEQYKKNKQVKK